MTEPLVHAVGLTASARQGTIFGPLDLDLYPGQLGIVHGDRGSGKSALLLSLTARFRRAEGTLSINGINAIEKPYEAMKYTSVARLADYVQPEDRLTIDESVVERCYIDAISAQQGKDRVREFEETLGMTIDHSCELEQLSSVERAVASVCLAMLRPAKVIVLDDADSMVPHRHQRPLFDILLKLAQHEDATIIAATMDDDSVPPEAVDLGLPRSKRMAMAQPIKLDQLPRFNTKRREAAAQQPGPDGFVPSRSRSEEPASYTAGEEKQESSSGSAPDPGEDSDGASTLGDVFRHDDDSSAHDNEE